LPSLGCTATASARQPSFEQQLFAGEHGGVIDWRVEAPVAEARFDFEGLDAVQGAGYVERILITMPPWRLPLRELRWGRWLDCKARRSVVWIEWRGPEPRCWVFVDGAKRSAEIADEGVSTDRARVVFDRSSILHERSFAEVAATIPLLKSITPKSFLQLRETKSCSAARLLEADSAPLHGFAIHEVVVFP
jgi:hypothetical protein